MQQLDLAKNPRGTPYACISKFTSQARSNRGTKDISGKVLLVDDEPAVLYYTCAMLERMGFQVVKVRSARAALQAFQSAGPFDLVLADVTLPEISGPQLLERLKQEKDFRALLISGLPHPGKGKPAANATPFLAKPFTYEDLQSTLRDLFDGPSGNGPSG